MCCVTVMVEQLVVKFSVSLFTDYSIWAEFLVPNTQRELSNSWRDPSRGTPSGTEYWYVTSQLSLRPRRHLSPRFTMWWQTIQIYIVCFWQVTFFSDGYETRDTTATVKDPCLQSRVDTRVTQEMLWLKVCCFSWMLYTKMLLWASYKCCLR